MPVWMIFIDDIFEALSALGEGWHTFILQVVEVVPECKLMTSLGVLFYLDKTIFLMHLTMRLCKMKYIGYSEKYRIIRGSSVSFFIKSWISERLSSDPVKLVIYICR